MEQSTIIILVLFAVLVFQQIYWSRQTQKLLDKLMSRDFHTYALSQKELVRKDGPKEIRIDDIDDQDLNVLRDVQGPLF